MKEKRECPLLLIFLGILVLVFVVYYPATTAGFIWDDDAYLTDNPLLRDGGGLWRIWSTTETPQYYPLVFTSFWIELRLWGLDPMGYHVVNILLHGINAALIGWVLRCLGMPGAWWVALLFAVHPVHVESVAWITERKNLLSALFYLLAFAAYLRFDEQRKKRLYWTALFLFVLALLGKTVTSTLPIALALALLYRNRRLVTTDLARLAPFCLLAIGMGLLTIRIEGGMIEAVRSDFDLSLLDRAVIAGKALLFYPWKLLYPHPLIFNYPRWDLTAGALRQAWPILVDGLVFLFLLGLWRKGHRGALLAFAYYAVTISPALGFVDVYPFRYSFVADHFQYLASVGVLVLVVAAVLELSGRIDRFNRSPRARWLLWGTGIAAIVALGASSWNQSSIYRNRESLWKDTVAKNPDSWLAHNNLGLIYLSDGRHELALESLNRAIESKPGSAESYTSRGLLHLKTRRYDEAMRDFDRAVELDPGYPQAYVNRGKLYRAMDRPDRALGELDKAIEIDPTYLDARIVRGRLHLTLMQYEQATRDLTYVIESNPHYLPAYLERGAARVRQGRYDEATADFTEALRRNPGYAPAYLERGRLRLSLEQLDPAVQDLTAYLGLRPSSPAAYVARGTAFLHLEQYDRAIGDYTLAIRLDDDNGDAYSYRGAAYLQGKQYESALADFTRAVELGHDLTKSHYNRGMAHAFLGHYPEALEDLTRAIERSPDAVKPYKRRAALYQTAFRDERRACADWRRACELGDCREYERLRQDGRCRSESGEDR